MDGKEYIDYCLAYGPYYWDIPTGIVDAVKKQLELGSTYGVPTQRNPAKLVTSRATLC